MPTAVNEGNAEVSVEEQQRRMWVALKAHVLRERARKRQQREAEVEEERQRRERERQDVMTHGEINSQREVLEIRLAHLKEEKHQLFRQLKKVLHEDDNRRRQKENDLMANNIPQMMAAPGMHAQLFLTMAPPNQPQSQMPPGAPQPFKGAPITTVKRSRSPSPPPLQQVPITYAQQTSGYATYKAPPQQPQYQPKEDTRRPHEFMRAVLWNKPSQYANQPNPSYYAVPPDRPTPIVYNIGAGMPGRNADGTPLRAPPGMKYINTYENNGMPPGSRAPPPQQAPSHVTVHGGAIPITPAQPASKTGSITTGYPVRGQAVGQYQQNPIYNSGGQSRQLYPGPPGGSMSGYPPPPRD